MADFSGKPSKIEFDDISLKITGEFRKRGDHITTKDGEATFFSMAYQYGSMGILAHNSFAGKHFSGIDVGETLNVEDKDGGRALFDVWEIHRFQALTPKSPYSDFIDLETDRKHSAAELFHMMYNEDNPLVLQTCIEKDGDINWGRMFIIGRRRRKSMTTLIENTK